VLQVSIAAAAIAALSSCAQTNARLEVGGPATRSIWKYKDPLMRALTDARATDRDTFLDALRSTDGSFPSVYWNGEDDPTSLGLARGGAAIYNLVEVGDEARFEAIITTSTEVDPVVYTCFQGIVRFEHGVVVDWSSDQEAGQPGEHCEAEIVDILSDDARVAPFSAFAG
jgi:hypothetical protein